MKRRSAGLTLVVVMAALTVTSLGVGAATSLAQGGASEAAPRPRPAPPALPLAAAPLVALRLNGRAPGTEPHALTLGEPVLLEVQLRHPDRRAKDPIRLEPPSGSWAKRVKIIVKDGRGAPGAWRFVLTGKPSDGGLALQPAAVTTMVLRLSQEGQSAVVAGSYTMVARLEFGDGRGFRGTVDSAPVNVIVAAATAAPVGAALGRRQLIRVRDALLRGDVAAAEAAAREAQQAEPRRPEGFIAMALVHEARGERSSAIQSMEIAISRAVDGDADESPRKDDLSAPRPSAAPRPSPRLVPAEYYEMLRRLEGLPRAKPG